MSAEKFVQTALAEVKYIEKASNSQLDSKSANPGRANYTKYGAWYGMNPAEWCDMYVSWCGCKSGESEAVGKFAYCPSHVGFFKAKGRYYPRGSRIPQPGDIIFFTKNGTSACHVGIVTSVNGGKVNTVEGNTSSDATLVSNGGAVWEKSYYLTSTYILGYGVPDFQGSTTITTGGEFEVPKTYRNGSTPETCYADTSMKVKTGSLNPWETCDCLGKAGDMYIVRYKVDGTNRYKVGLVKYNGGLT